MIDMLTEVAHEAAKWTWPVVHVPLPAQRKIGDTPKPSSLFWPGREGREGLEYVTELGAVSYTHWVGNAVVAQYATPDAIMAAIDECRKVIAATQDLLRLARESDAYKRLEQMTDALVLSGAIAPEAIKGLGEFRPLVVPCYMMRSIRTDELHGSRVRNLVDAVINGEIDGDTEVTVSRENSELRQVVVRVYKSLHVVFHFWGSTWASCAACWFGIRNDLEIRAIGDSYSDQTWQISHVCASPEEVIELINRLAEVKWLLGIDTED